MEMCSIELVNHFPAVKFLNHVSYLLDRDQDQILISYNIQDEVYIIDHNPSTEDDKGPAGDLLWWWGADWIYNDNQYGWTGLVSRPTPKTWVVSSL
jgi:hypothetical protein